MQRSLADFLEQLSRRGELARVAVAVDPALELAAVARATPLALVFEKVAGQRLPVAANLLATPSRLLAAARCESLEQLAERTAPLLMPGARPAASERHAPRPVKQAESQQVVRLGRDIDLGELPAVSTFPEESAKVLSGALLACGESGNRSFELVRLAVLDRNRLALVDDGQLGWPRRWAAARQQGVKLPVVAVLGGDPAWLVAGGIPAPLDVDGYLLAGALGDAPPATTAARSQPLAVPAGADVVIEGVIEPDEPLANVTIGGASATHYRTLEAPVVQVSAVTHRAKAIIPHVGYAPGDEPNQLRSAIEAVLRPVVEAVVPGLAGFSLPCGAPPRSAAVLSIRKTYSGQAQQAVAALRGLSALAATKLVIVVDAEVPAGNLTAVWGEVMANVHSQRDVAILAGPGDPRDHAGPQPPLGSSLVLDATRKLPGEHPRAWPARAVDSAETLELVRRRWEEYGLTGAAP